MQLIWLAAALALGTLVASRHGSPLFVYGVIVTVILWLAAVLIAGVLLAPVRLFTRPSRAAIATALAIGGLVVFPVYGEFSDDPDWPEANCSGYLPLAQAVHLATSDGVYAPLGFQWGCED